MQHDLRLEVARARWAEILDLRRTVTELQTTCAQSGLVPGTDPVAEAFSMDPVSGMEFVCVPGGKFAMGDVYGTEEPDEQPVHVVEVPGFCLAKTPVTQSQWQAVTGANPSAHPGPDRPVDSVSWEDSQEFLRELRKRTGTAFRLPTEAEWEFAATSGGRYEQWAGTNDRDSLGDFAWFVANSGGTSQPVGLKRPNRLGLFDMSGNVWEWCEDWYREDAYERGPPRNPRRVKPGARRVARGGSWADEREFLFTVYRGALQPEYRMKTHGLRVAASLEAVLPPSERDTDRG